MCFHPSINTLLGRSFFVFPSLERRKKTLLPGHVCFSVQHKQAHVIISQMIYIFPSKLLYGCWQMLVSNAKHNLAEVSFVKKPLLNRVSIDTCIGLFACSSVLSFICSFFSSFINLFITPNYIRSFFINVISVFLSLVIYYFSMFAHSW